MKFRDYLKEANEWGVLPHELTEAEYQGRKVKLNDPMRTVSYTHLTLPTR